MTVKLTCFLMCRGHSILFRPEAYRPKYEYISKSRSRLSQVPKSRAPLSRAPPLSPSPASLPCAASLPRAPPLSCAPPSTLEQEAGKPLTPQVPKSPSPQVSQPTDLFFMVLIGQEVRRRGWCRRRREAIAASPAARRVGASGWRSTSHRD